MSVNKMHYGQRLLLILNKDSMVNNKIQLVYSSIKHYL